MPSPEAMPFQGTTPKTQAASPDEVPQRRGSCSVAGRYQANVIRASQVRAGRLQPNRPVRCRMDAHIVTGPDLVGLEMMALPSVARVTRRMAGASVLVRAPRCRFGSAWYVVGLASPSHRRTRRQYVEITSTLRSGCQIVRPIPDEWDDVEVVLNLVDVRLTAGALSTLSTDALIEALTHPLESVRQAAICGMHRVRSEES